MRISRLVIAALVSCAALLSACGGQFSPTNRARVAPQYSAGESHYVAGNGSMWVVINGNPFRFHDKHVSDQIARRAMRGAHYGPRVNFVAYRPSGRSENYRVVLFYYAPRSFGGAMLCSGQRRPRPDRPQGNFVTVLAAYCRGDQRLTEVRGTTLAFRPDDPRFTDMIRKLTYRLFPRDEPSRRNDS